jgi:hypothetical protein
MTQQSQLPRQIMENNKLKEDRTINMQKQAHQAVNLCKSVIKKGNKKSVMEINPIIPA